MRDASWFRRSEPAPQQKDQEDDQQDYAEAAAVVMIWRSIIEAASAKKKD